MIPRRVLIVQHDKHLRDVLSRALERGGYSVIAAATGECAADALSAHQVDGVILDLSLPNMSGQTLFHVIVSQWPELRRRIAITSDEESRRKHEDWLALYQLPVLAKPFRLADVRDIAESIIGKERLEANGA